jgi:hypothetical protein
MMHSLIVAENILLFCRFSFFASSCSSHAFVVADESEEHYFAVRCSVVIDWQDFVVSTRHEPEISRDVKFLTKFPLYGSVIAGNEVKLSLLFPF